MNIFELVERVSPKMCRIVARSKDGRHALSFADIATASGLGVSTVKNYARRTTWRGLPIDKVVAYASACGVNHMQARQTIDFIKRRRWTHMLNNRHPQQRAMFQRLMSEP